jgi:malonyl-CoA/methylmalonyl-CoA synthetase
MRRGLPPLLARAAEHAGRTAVVAGEESFTYQDLDAASCSVATALRSGRADLEEARIVYLVPPGFAHVAVQWGIWRAGGLAVPLAISHPPAELEYVLRDAEADAVVADPGSAGLLHPLAGAAGARFVTTPELFAVDGEPGPAIAPDRAALMLYTSGTTGRPKGVVITHANIAAQIESLVRAWEWTRDDRILLVLPLHHVHGIVNVLCCALWTGATCEILPRFDADATWARLASGELTLFMAVPTIYHRLISAWDAAPDLQAARSRGCRHLRLMVSGSAALPLPTLERWREISGHVLLERYGMTEIGMALSNPLHGDRRPGFVGQPLPGMEVRLVGDRADDVADGTPGEIEVRGPNVFREYWRRPDATRTAFRNGWFRTGDVAIIDDGAFRILGRTSIDILKTGGHKVSALEIEEVLRTHPAVGECAVVGVPDVEWGDLVCAAVEVRAGQDLSLEWLQSWAKDRLAPYKIPRRLRIVEALPRNALGKVIKPAVSALFNAGDPAKPAA